MIGEDKFVSLFRIMEEMNMDFKFLSAEIDWQDLLVWTSKYIGLVGSPKMYVTKTTGEHPLTPHIVVSQHRGELPVDFITELPGGVRDASSHDVYLKASDSFYESYSKSVRTQNQSDESLKVEQPYEYADHMTYAINDYYLILSDEEANIELAYKAIRIDEKGYPMIPDNERIIEGLKWFIAEKVAFNMWGASLMSKDVFQEIKQNRDWYFASAQSASVQMSPDEMETFSRAWVRLNPAVHQHAFSFRFMGLREDLNIGT